MRKNVLGYLVAPGNALFIVARPLGIFFFLGARPVGVAFLIFYPLMRHEGLCGLSY